MRWSAFARMDVESALRVARQDRLVDEEYEKGPSNAKERITFMMEDLHHSAGCWMSCGWCVRSSRSATMRRTSANTSIYMVHEKDIRHTSLEDVERELGQKRSGSTASPQLPDAIRACVEYDRVRVDQSPPS